MKKHKKDLLAISVLLLIAVAGWLANLYMHQQPAARLEISVDGTIVQTMELDKDDEFLIPGHGGGTNRLVIQDGTAWVSEASCPDKVCIHQGKIQLHGQMIVCLPNKMIARIISEP